MNIQHHPIFDVEKVATLYTEKDGVPVRYVCTSAPNKSATYAADIFYRETPHPEFGNRYFGLYPAAHDGDIQVMITNADPIEDLTFEMAEVNGELHYSQHRHDYRSIGNGVAIDGGRDYFRATFMSRPDSFVRKTLRVENGKFVEVVL